MTYKSWLSILLAAFISSCARVEATRTSQNTMIIDAAAAVDCGSAGAARAASKGAALETIRAGFDRYIITSGSAANNVHVVAMPGHYSTFGTVGIYGNFNATTTYQPGPSFVTGSHDRSLSVVMFKPGDAGFENAIDARQVLGPGWQEIVKSGVHSCM